MKHWICVCLTCMALLMFSGVGYMAMSNNQIGVVKVCGTALTLGGEEVAKDNAFKDAQHRAVAKATARFLTPSPAKDSPYQKIVSNYGKYLAGKIKVVKKQKTNGKYMLFCDVPVNFALIDADIKSFVSEKQNSEKNELDEAVFLVRVVGLDDADAIQKIPFKVLLDYEHAFKELGFAAQGADLSGSAAKNMLTAVNAIGKNIVSYDEYRQVMLKSLREHMMEVTLAVLGEIRVTKVLQMESSVYAEVECLVESIAIGDDGIKVIGEHKEMFNANRPDKKTAVSFAIQKAAVNSSRNLANMTLNYWKQK